MQAPTQDEITSSRKILIETDPDSRAILTHDAAVALLFPRLRLPRTSSPGGTKTDGLENFETAWRVIDSLASQEGFMRQDQVMQLVRLMGYAQTGEKIAGADLKDISNMLQRPGPSCRIYGWTVPEGHSFEKAPSPEEAMLADAILIEGGKYQYGILDGEAARDVFRRSGLDNTTLASIWELVDEDGRGFLKEKEVFRMLRLISCAQRGLRLHARQYENPSPLPDLDDSFIQTEDPAPAQVVLSTNRQDVPPPSSIPPSFPIPQTSLGPSVVQSSTRPSFLPPGLPIPQPAPPTRTVDDPLPPLTDKERTAFMAIFDKNDPQGGVLSGAQGYQILSRSQLPREVLAQIWDLADADRSGSLSRGEFVVAMYLVKLLMERRRNNPGREEEQMPREVPPWLRVEAARMDGGAVPGTTPMSNIALAGDPIGPGGFRVLATLQAPAQPRPETVPPPTSLLDTENELAPSQPSLDRRGSSTRPPQDPRLQDYLNRPVPLTPPELVQRRSEELGAPPPYVELDYTVF